MPSKSSREQREDEEGAAAVAEFVQILEEHKKTCEREGKYIEADIAKKRCACV